jgi:hypothetical protein
MVRWRTRWRRRQPTCGAHSERGRTRTTRSLTLPWNYIGDPAGTGKPTIPDDETIKSAQELTATIFSSISYRSSRKDCVAPASRLPRPDNDSLGHFFGRIRKRLTVADDDVEAGAAQLVEIVGILRSTYGDTAAGAVGELGPAIVDQAAASLADAAGSTTSRTTMTKRTVRTRMSRTRMLRTKTSRSMGRRCGLRTLRRRCCRGCRWPESRVR